MRLSRRPPTAHLARENFEHWRLRDLQGKFWEHIFYSKSKQAHANGGKTPGFYMGKWTERIIKIKQNFPGPQWETAVLVTVAQGKIQLCI